MVEFDGLSGTRLLSLPQFRYVQRFVVEKVMWGLSFVANSSPEFKTFTIEPLPRTQASLCKETVMRI